MDADGLLRFEGVDGLDVGISDTLDPRGVLDLFGAGLCSLLISKEKSSIASPAMGKVCRMRLIDEPEPDVGGRYVVVDGPAAVLDGGMD